MSAADPPVAVVMITWNRREEVLRTLGHLTRLPERPRIIVVDNGSHDGTPAAVRERFPAVTVIEAGANLGAAGRTLGVRAVDTLYVAFCDDDSWWEPGDLRRAADLFDAHPRLAVVTARVLVGPGREDPTCAEMARSPLPAFPGLPGHPLLGFLAGASMVRRSAFLEAGGFGTAVGLGGEEEWLAVELASRGWAMCYVPYLTVYHHPSRQRDGARRRWHLLRNALWFAWLRRPFGSALRRTLGLARAEPWDRTTLKGFTTALAGLPRLLPRRRVVPEAVENGLHLLEMSRPKKHE